MKDKKTFVRKPYDKFLYKWSPCENFIKNNGSLGNTGLPLGCTAPPFSQGEDFITTYVYEYILEGSNVHQYAYVECDYVK